MKNNKQILSVFFFLLLTFPSKAQYMVPADMPSPNASELGHFGDVPVSYYTGRPDVSIPLYEFDVRGVKLNISLQYESSGVLMNTLPGWTGHNWVLNAGGVITRVRDGACDEYVVPNYANHPNRTNYFHGYGILKDIMENDNSSHSRLRDSVIYGNREDWSPDIFYFNAMGLSGRFFLGNDGQWKVYSERNIDVLFNVNDASNYIYPFIERYPYSGNAPYKQPKTIKGFVLRDEDGNEYHFGGTKDFIEYTTDFYRMSDREYVESWMANSWYLNKVTDRHGNVLYSFSYTRGKFIPQLYENSFNMDVRIRLGSSFYESYSNGNFNIPFGGRLVSPVYLNKITMLDGRNVFFSSEDVPYNTSTSFQTFYRIQGFGEPVNQSKVGYYYQYPYYYLQTSDADITPYQYNPLEGGKVFNPLLATCLRKLGAIKCNDTPSANYEFEYSFNSRMHMTGIRIRDDAAWYTGGDVGLHGRYSFIYHHFDSIPADYTTRATDYWGYYNGNPYTLSPSVYGYYLSGSREVSTTHSQYGLLKEIIYPTGGKTVIEYEQNDYSATLAPGHQSLVAFPSTMPAGGVRVKSISAYEDSTNNNLLSMRNFNYLIPHSGYGSIQRSSGILYSKPTGVLHDWSVWDGNNPYNVELSLFSTVSIIPLANTFGSHIGYSYVTESIGDVKKRYHYSSHYDERDAVPIYSFSGDSISPYLKNGSREYSRGRLLSVETFLGDQLKEKKSYTYCEDTGEYPLVYTSNTGLIIVGYQHIIPLCTGSVYGLYFHKYDIIADTTEIYDGSGIVTVHEYHRKDSLISVYGNCYGHVNNIRLLDYEIEKRGTSSYKTQYKYSFTPSSYILRPSEWRHYLNGTFIDGHKIVYGSISGKYLPKYELSLKTSTWADTTVIYKGYTSTGALQKYKEMGKPTTTLTWIANDCWMASIEEGPSETIPTIPQSNQFNQTQMIDYFNSYRETTSNLVTSYTYKTNGSLSSITDPNGITTYYVYDSLNRLQDIIDKDGRTVQHFEYNYRHKH